MNDLHEFNVVLKSRQLGCTSFIQIFMLDAALFNSNVRAGTIAHRLEDARTIFRDRVRLVYDHLPDWLKKARPIVRDSADELEFSNNSSIRVATSMRSGTLGLLHVSEFGSLCAKYPDKAKEVITGSLNTLATGSVCFVESTADGCDGAFFDICEAARTKQRLGAKLTPLDFKFHFFPWWKEPGYELDPAGAEIEEPLARYFAKLQDEHGIVLTPAQQFWYQKKAETQAEAIGREYPSTPDEAFASSVEGAYYSAQLAKCEREQRIGSFSVVPNYAVHVSWDIGVSDSTSLWLYQILPGRVRLLGCYENSGEGLPHYLDWLEQAAAGRGWKLGKHFMPADISVREWGTGKSRAEVAISEVRKRGLGAGVVRVPLIPVADGIGAVRELLAICEFDAAGCADGLRALRNYRKDWNEELGTWRDRPRHDANSHFADSFRYLAVSHRDVPVEPEPPNCPRDPLGREIKPIPRNRFLSELTYDELHEVAFPERRTERV